MAMTLRLDKDDEQLLARLAEQDGVSRQAAVINAIHEVAERRGHEAQVGEASKRARERYGDLLDRLGK
ncbi:MAG: CopG family transcriptional regulator [Brevibacterium aurantiacum]|uniref:CopG family transcriptional regulator n=2 Tax=Brevibacterium aurantiacum TaxID=273384 RepID=A0A1D7VZA7_BREAU|nr:MULTISPECIES: CopG family transcriptional regulator [Brevibacterium]AOP52070.1 Prevent host death protein, Phd antitoxin [Brevibacterium aurantiacum]AZL08075.1 CopG family transcriptional regulator [Brevibacterium aurantiacum]AZL11688.1 CopG family transcriptional regulator [Brevibacterium aurantiacum]AZT95925.1 CopG family transcriptional regulator [Brevibacterium aurantiacum]MCI4012192.1 CopG family transcriptional regulator [Brevibacterium sp. ZH18]